MSSTPRLLWHASRADIDRPTLAGRTVGDNHDNSGLGIFCATEPHDYIIGFGEFVHELTVRPDAKVLRMTLAEFAALSRRPWQENGHREWFEQEGRRLAQEYDLVDLVEITGVVEQSIILRDEAIVASRKFSAQEYMARAKPRSPSRPMR